LSAAYRLRGTYEWLTGHERSAIDWWTRSIGLAVELGAQYELGVTYLEMGKRLDDRDRLDQADAVFDQIHFHPDVQHIQSELGEQE
jgi:hypothetical protein